MQRVITYYLVSKHDWTSYVPSDTPENALGRIEYYANYVNTQ